MSRVYHPTIHGVSHEVPTKDVKRWKRSGWLSEPPTSTQASPSIPDEDSTPAPPDAANEKE